MRVLLLKMERKNPFALVLERFEFREGLILEGGRGSGKESGFGGRREWELP